MNNLINLIKRGPRYHLNLSHGYHIYNHHLNLTKDEFIDIVDRKMYLNKTKSKEEITVTENNSILRTFK